MFGTTSFATATFASSGSSEADSTAPVVSTLLLSLAAVDASDSLRAEAFIGAVPVIVSLNAGDASDVLAAGLRSTVTASLTQTDVDDTLNAQVSVPSVLRVQLAVIDASDTLRALVSVETAREFVLNVRDASDTLKASTVGGRRVYGGIPSCRNRFDFVPHGCGRPPNLQDRC